MNPMAVLVMGSESDLPDAIPIEEMLAGFGVHTNRQILSAHRNTEDVLVTIHNFDRVHRESGSPLVYVAVVGKKPDLGPVIAGSTDNPVVMYVKRTEPEAFYPNHLLSALDAPPGISYAVFSDPSNAALYVAKIIGLQEAGVREKVHAYRTERAARNIAASQKYGSMSIVDVKAAIGKK